MLAEDSPSLERIDRAIQMDPANDLYLILRAQRKEELGGNSLADWQRAIEVNPRRGFSLTQAAIAAEISGDLATAERLFLQAEHYNQLWLPRWSLANYYARNGRSQDLFRAARLALERAWPDQLPLLRLCRENGASDSIFLSEIIPPRPRNLAAFISLLIEEQSFDHLPDATLRFLQSSRTAGEPGAAAAPVVATAVTALLDANRPTDAINIWNAAFTSRWSKDAPLINLGLDAPAEPPGLDWSIPMIAGIDTNRGLPPGGIKFTFSGSQPESAELLSQTVYLPGGRTWTLGFEFQTRNITASQEGITWVLTPRGGGSHLSPLPPPSTLVSEDWAPASVSWALPAEDQIYRLALTLRRPAGQVRPEGELFLRSFSFRSNGQAR